MTLSTTRAADRPLSGLRVLDLSQGIAGPYCGGLFAEYGARVIKIEPPHGDWMRPLGVGVDGISASFLYYNRGKESLALDLKAEGAVDTIKTLAAQSDVLIENNRPGVSERLGFGFETIRALQPHIVYVSVSGLGQRGPDIKLPTTDTIAQARSGLMSINKGRSGVPGKVDTPIVDSITGLYAFQAATMALWGANDAREARHLDVNLLQSAAAIQGAKVLEYGLLGEMPQNLNTPAGSYPTADGWIAIALVRESEWQKVCQLIGRPDLCDGIYATFVDRARVAAEMAQELDPIFQSKSSRDWVDLLGSEGIMTTVINDYGDWLDDPQTQANDGAPEAPVAPHRTAPIVRTPGQMLHTALAPRLGEHSRRILEDAGLSTEAIESLVAAGSVICTDDVV